MIDFGRETCGNLEAAAQREWLATNGTGSYASGTVAGLLTRRYHGILIAALKPPVERTLLVAKLEETAEYDGGSYALSCNRWADGRVEPEGYRNIERFHLEGATPVWTYACADALLEKRIWMLPGANTTCIRYLYLRPSGAYRPLALSIRPLVNFRDHHGFTRSGELDLGVQAVEGGFRITPNVRPGSEPA
ncbi:MAG TPA: glycogen debranching enzyme N-terminal domain-containing protein, partial [Anaerolineales bacterium]